MAHEGDDAGNLRNALDEIGRVLRSLAEQSCNVDQRDLMVGRASEIRQDRHGAVEKVDDRLERLKHLADRFDQRSEKFVEQLSEVELDIIKREMRRGTA